MIIEILFCARAALWLSHHPAEANWGRGVVKDPAVWLAMQALDLKGLSSSNLWRMKQFYERYAELPKLATSLRVLSWSKHLLLLSQCRSPDAKEFYLIAATRGHWSHRELQRQPASAAFERTMLSDRKLAPAVRVLPQDATGVFKDSYLLDFLDLPERHSEADLQTGLLRNLRKFLMELGDGCAFVGASAGGQSGFRARSTLLSSRPTMSRRV
jgi:predicted nuclease of restriction endonuclease-like (RecB) superfamily